MEDKIKLTEEEKTLKISSLNFGKNDVFSEFYSYFCYIIEEDGDSILVLERMGQQVGKIIETTKSDFEKYLKHTTNNGYWCTYIGNSPENTLKMIKYFNQESNIVQKRELISKRLNYK